MEVIIIPASGSDQCLIQLWLDTAISPQHNMFLFKNFYVSHPDFQENTPT